MVWSSSCLPKACAAPRICCAKLGKWEPGVGGNYVLHALDAEFLFTSVAHFENAVGGDNQQISGSRLHALAIECCHWKQSKRKLLLLEMGKA